jgi:hypothetical protein
VVATIDLLVDAVMSLGGGYNACLMTIIGLLSKWTISKTHRTWAFLQSIPLAALLTIEAPSPRIIDQFPWIFRVSTPSSCVPRRHNWPASLESNLKRVPTLARRVSHDARNAATATANPCPSDNLIQPPITIFDLFSKVYVMMCELFQAETLTVHLARFGARTF